MTIRIFAAGFLLPLCVMAQESADTSQVGFVTVRSLPSGAHVFVDSVFSGVTPLERLQLPAGDHELRVFYPSPFDWNAFVQQKSLRLEGGVEI